MTFLTCTFTTTLVLGVNPGGWVSRPPDFGLGAWLVSRGCGWASKYYYSVFCTESVIMHRKYVKKWSVL